MVNIASIFYVLLFGNLQKVVIVGAIFIVAFEIFLISVYGLLASGVYAKSNKLYRLFNGLNCWIKMTNLKIKLKVFWQNL